MAIDGPAPLSIPPRSGFERLQSGLATTAQLANAASLVLAVASALAPMVGFDSLSVGHTQIPMSSITLLSTGSVAGWYARGLSRWE